MPENKQRHFKIMKMENGQPVTGYIVRAPTPKQAAIIAFGIVFGIPNNLEYESGSETDSESESVAE